MTTTITEDDWVTLIQRIQLGKCTPFLGAGICAGTLPLGGTIAREWAKKFGYHIEDCSDLVRVAQYVAVKHDFLSQKNQVISARTNIW